MSLKKLGNLPSSSSTPGAAGEVRRRLSHATAPSVGPTQPAPSFLPTNTTQLIPLGNIEKAIVESKTVDETKNIHDLISGFEETYRLHGATKQELNPLIQKRMFDKPPERIHSIYCGKLGEEAVGHYFNIPVNYSENIDNGYDLILDSQRLAIKTKGVIDFPISFTNWYCHIPCDQYLKLKNHANSLIACILKEQTLEIAIVGFLPISEVDKVKILHQAGQEITKRFTLPPPDSFGVPYELFKPIEQLKFQIALF